MTVFPMPATTGSRVFSAEHYMLPGVLRLTNKSPKTTVKVCLLQQGQSVYSLVRTWVSDVHAVSALPTLAISLKVISAVGKLC